MSDTNDSKEVRNRNDEGHMKLLFVDDNKDYLEYVNAFLSDTAYCVATEDNPVAALDRLKNEDFHIIISDVKMPEMNGIDLLKNIKKLDKHATVILNSTLADPATEIEAIKNGAFAFYEKTLLLFEIARIVETYRRKQEYVTRLQNESDTY